MTETQKYWNKLIQVWCIEDDKYGLTIPFIIGAIRENTSKSNYNISDFFNDILITESDIIIKDCSDLGELVVGIFKKEDAPKEYYQKINSVFYSDTDFKNKLLNYENLIEYFEKNYSERINESLFSKDYYTHKWSGMTEEDNIFLEKVNRK